MLDQDVAVAALAEREEQALPQGWAIAKVGDFCKLIGGGTPSTQNESYWQGTIPWITSADIEGITDIRPRKAITERAIRDSATNMVAAGSIIVVTRVGLGKVALVSQPLCFSQDCQALVFDTSIFDSLYLTYYLKSAVQVFKRISRGTTISGVTKKQLQEIAIVIPSHNEQKRIVEAIEMHFTRLDAAIAGLKQVQAKLKRYRSAVLKAAVEGTLTGAYRFDAKNSSQTDIAKRITELQMHSVSATRKRAGRLWGSGVVPVLSAEEKRRLPSGWLWAKVRDLGPIPEEVVQVGPMSMRSQDFVKNGVPVLDVGCVQWDYIDETKLNFCQLTRQLLLIDIVFGLGLYSLLVLELWDGVLSSQIAKIIGS
jgi:hypothetical protein